MVVDAVRGHLEERGITMPVDVVAEYHTSAFIGLLGWWVRAGFPYGPGEMTPMCRDLTEPAFGAAH